MNVPDNERHPDFVSEIRESMEAQIEAAARAESQKRAYINEQQRQKSLEEERQAVLLGEQKRVAGLVRADAAAFASYLLENAIEPTVTIELRVPIQTYGRRKGFFGRNTSASQSRRTHEKAWLVTEGYISKEIDTSFKDSYSSRTAYYAAGIALTSSEGLVHYIGPESETEDVSFRMLSMSGKVSNEDIIPLDSIEPNDAEQSIQHSVFNDWHGKLVEMAAREMIARQRTL